MMNIVWFLALSLQDDPKLLEQKARERAAEMRQECAAALESVDGVGSIGVGGTGADYRILIVVRDAQTQRQVRDLLGGDEYGGVPIVWSIADPARRPPPPPAPEPFQPKPPPMQPPPDPERARNPWNASVTDCDIIRDHLKLKKITHPAGNGKSWVPCQVMKRTTIGPGGGHSFTYTNHRPDCPVRMGRVGEPSWSDNYMAWVFRSGITAPAPTNFTLPGNGWTWAAQAAADMGSRAPVIREASQGVWVPGFGWVAQNGYPYSYPYYSPYYYYPYYYSPYRHYWRSYYYYPRWYGYRIRYR